MALATATSLNLGLDNEASLVAESLGNFEGLLSSGGKCTLLNVDAVLSHEVLAVEFMQIKETTSGGGQLVAASEVVNVAREHLMRKLVDLIN